MKIPRQDRLKWKKQFGSHFVAIDLKNLLLEMADQGISRETELSERSNRLRQLGFDDYKDYVTSTMWLDKREEYKQSHLQQCCMVCKEKSFCLHHTNYSNLGKEDIKEFLPLCGRHHDLLHKFLEEYNIPYSKSLISLGFALRVNNRTFNRSATDFQKFLLKETFLKMGFSFEIIGTKSGKIIRTKKDNLLREYTFDAANMKIQGIHVMDFVSSSNNWRERLGKKVTTIRAELGSRMVNLKFKEV